MNSEFMCIYFRFRRKMERTNGVRHVNVMRGLKDMDAVMLNGGSDIP